MYSRDHHAFVYRAFLPAFLQPGHYPGNGGNLCFGLHKQLLAVREDERALGEEIARERSKNDCLTSPGRQGDQGRPETALVSPLSSRDCFGLVGPELYVRHLMKRLCRTHLRGLNSGRDFMVSGPANPRNANHAAPPRAFLLALFAANEKPHTAAHKPPVALTARLRRCYERMSVRIEIASKTDAHV